ncbi:16S rRNA (cytosine(1402)-N(4))-methyltransferase RsmH [Candidatus Bipolaricaulota bacterium]|nr:16S rRNA (cytosine(1402)-N(4))-methyltransferase RsmH [Candidatus Bipolaricaulota bacterium]
MSDAIHRPVMRAEAVRFLAPDRGGIYVDGTVGLGGHAAAILAAGPEARLIGIDRDPQALRYAAARLAQFGDRVRLVHGNYRDLAEILAGLGIEAIDGFLLDLGLSSLQLDAPERGFSFRADGPLDMRMDPTQKTSAADLVNAASVEELARILRDYGEERFAGRIARAIVAARPIETTRALAEVVRRAIPRRFHERRIDPATRTFQALRIAVNDELRNLQDGLAAGFAALRPGGVIVVISFHSLEDRIVKRFFRKLATPRYESLAPGPPLPPQAEVLTKKPLRPSEEEIGENPRARSAKLRACRKL